MSNKHLSHYLTNSLQYTDDGPEVPHVEHRQGQVYVPVVTHAVGQAQPTCVTVGILLVCTLQKQITAYYLDDDDDTGVCKFLSFCD